jgi:hypothetical protein
MYLCDIILFYCIKTNEERGIKMKIIVNVIRWICVSLLAMLALSTLIAGGVIGALLFILCAALIAPITPIRKLRRKCRLNRALSIILAIALMFGGMMAIPSAEAPNDTNITDSMSDDSSQKNDTETTSGQGDTQNKEESSSQEENQSESSETQIAECTHTSTSTKNKLDATCVENGYSGDTYCDLCNELIQYGILINAFGHNTEIRNQTSATTTSEGYTGDTYCKVCNTKVESGKTIPKVEESVQGGSGSTTVYITETGSRYHCTKHCSGLANAKAIYETTLENAKQKGLTPCKKCY